MGVDVLLQLAGQNFFVLYLCAACGYARIHRGQPHRWIAYLAIVSVVVMMSLFSLPGLLYCAALAALGAGVGAAKARMARPA